ncbi:sensor histidine kinase [Mucilaginibacter pallidiroseus]|nr:sensor histidine kinase [Mucilaginibacter pallidiroseus]
MKPKYLSIIQKRLLPVVWVILFVSYFIPKANAQHNIGGSEGFARQNMPALTAFRTQAVSYGVIWPHICQPNNIRPTVKRIPDFIYGPQRTEKIPDPAFNYKSSKSTHVLSVRYVDEKGDHKNIPGEGRHQPTQMTGRVADMNKNLKIAVGGLLLLIIVLLLQLYRIRLNDNRSMLASQRELDQKNTFIETLNSNQEKLLKEKEWLLKEVQHRVKNSLQVVTSLLYSQSLYLEDGAAIQAIKDSLRRMQAMSLIHQKLYQDNNTSTISMPEYIDDLVAYLYESFDADSHIVFERAIEPIELDVSQVLPLGLIFTEGIVNAIKYAFLKGQQGVVRLYLGYDGPGHLLLEISDNGIGLPAGLDAMEHNSLGLDLIQGLSKQLKGNFRIENNNGVKITVRFAV